MKREIIVWTERELTKKERKNFKKENPGKRLCFRLRYQNFPLFFSLISLFIGAFELLVWLLI